MKFTSIARALAALLIITLSAAGAAAQEETKASQWPQEIDTPQATIIVYQPQLEKFEGDRIEARSAVSVTTKGTNNPVFGAVWYEGRLDVDRDARTATLVELKVPAAKFPDAKDEQIAWLTNVLETEMTQWQMELSLDDLIAAAGVVEQQQATSANLNNDPPKIIYRTEPAVLVMIDGEPKMRDVENSNLKYVGNTAFVIIQDGSTNYLKGGATWYSSKKITEGWTVMSGSPPSTVVTFAEKNAAPPDSIDNSEAGGQSARPPVIVVSTEPAELIQVNGEPDFRSVEGTQLLYMQNTESDILMYVPTQEYFVLLAGRWYKSRSLADGPWKWVPFDALPNDFEKIPPGSDMADVRASVPGTQEAKEAILDNQVPQTAAVDRMTATVNVTYDGDPKFETIEGTKMSYAVNTDKSVLLIDGRYYCCDQAIWYESDNPKGPWKVSTATPNGVQNIPPESPVYNVKYVYVYDTTPDVVYVGYTPGYYGSYYYHGCIVYGTGYYYRPWYSPYYYYPRPVTYGFGVHYNPYTGWGFSVGVSNGWFSVRVGWGGGYGGYWGPRGYYPGYRHGYHHGYGHGYYAGYKAANRPRPTPYHNNIYRGNNAVRNTRDIATRPSTRPATPSKRPAAKPGTPSTRPATPSQRPTAKPSTRPNNVYADRNGNVYRKTDKGWEQRNKGGWSPQKTDRSARDRSTQQNLNKQYQSRQRSQTRNQSYHQQQNRSRQQPSRQPQRSGGKRR